MYLDFIFFYLLSFTVSVLLTFLIVVSKKFHGKFVLDTHDGPQKIHDGNIARLGGVSIFVSFFFTLYILSFNKDVDHNLFVILIFTISPLFFIGFMEDILKNIKPVLRLFISLLSGLVGYLIFNLSIKNFGINIFDLIIQFPIASCLLIILFISIISNALNLIDGLNGFASGYTLIFMGSIFYITYSINDILLSQISLLVIFSTFGFIYLIGQSQKYF